jgi:predicted P-loop ATPase
MNNYQVKGINPSLHAFFEGLGLTVDKTLTEQELKDFYKNRSFQVDQEDRIFNGSGVSRLFEQSIVYKPQIDYSGSEPEPTDLDLLLFGKELVPTRWQKKLEAILFLNDPTSRLTTDFNKVWQGIVNISYEGKPYRYLARKQSIKELNDRPFYPFIPNEIRKRIGDRYGIPFGNSGRDEEEVPCIPTEEEGSFWDWWIDYGHPMIPLFITEGAKKNLSLLSRGCLAIALYGCQCGSQEGKTKKGKGRVIKEALAPFLPEFATIIIAMDNDSFGNFDKTEPGKINLIMAARNSCQQGSVHRLTWDPIFKGVDDLIVNNPSLFEERLKIALHPHFKSKMGILIESLYTRFGSALRFNLLSKKIELNGEPLDTDGILAWWYKWFPYSDTPSLEHLKQALRHHSKQNQYNPVKEFLEYLDSIDSAKLPIVDVNKLSTRFLKTDHPFYDILLYKTLLAAVARVMKPGCQVDTVCILQGSQGLKKSTFWTAMAVFPDWCRRNFNATYGKDGLIAIGRYWFLELDEIEAVLSKKDVEYFKSMVTSRSDGYRPPYGTQEEIHPRHSVFVGSCNKKEFLRDIENRRIWMIPVSQRNSEPSPLEVISIWKQMVAEYHQNREWWLTPREEEIHKVFTKEYCQTDSFADVLSEHSDLIATQRLTTTEIAIKFLGFENVSRLSRIDQNRLSESLRYLGFELVRETKGKNRDKKIWVLPEKSQYPVSTQSVPTSNPYGERVPENDKKSVPMSVPTLNPDGERVTAVLGTDNDKNSNFQNVSSGNKEKLNLSQEIITGTYNIEFEEKPKVSTQMPETGSVTGLEVGTDKNQVSTQKTENGSVTGLEVGTDMGTDFSSGYPVKVKWDDKWKDCPSVYFLRENKKFLGRLIAENTIVYADYNKTRCQWLAVKTSEWEFQAIAK